MKAWVFVASLLMASVIAAEAQSPPARLVPFQARLTDVGDQPVADGVYKLTFNIYDQAEAGETCWTEVHPSVSVISGQVNVILGAIESLDAPEGDTDAAINFNPTSGNNCTPTAMMTCACQGRGQRYLGITIGDNPLEMVPRHQLLPSFHARRADISDDIVDGKVTTNKIANSAVTDLKLAGSAVTSAKIADGAITGLKLSTSLFADNNGIRSDQIKDGEIKGGDVTTTDVDGLTGANIKDGSIGVGDLGFAPVVSVGTGGAVKVVSARIVYTGQNPQNPMLDAQYGDWVQSVVYQNNGGSADTRLNIKAGVFAQRPHCTISSEGEGAVSGFMDNIGGVTSTNLTWRPARIASDGQYFDIHPYHVICIGQ